MCTCREGTDRDCGGRSAEAAGTVLWSARLPHLPLLRRWHGVRLRVAANGQARPRGKEEQALFLHLSGTAGDGLNVYPVLRMKVYLSTRYFMRWSTRYLYLSTLHLS